MADRKILLARFRKMFGDCSRRSFLQRVRNFNGAIEVDTDINIEREEDYGEQLVPSPPQVKMIDINGTDAWLNHVRALKNISVLNGCLKRYKTLLEKSTMIVYYGSVKKSLTAMLNYADKHFKEPQDITDETGEEVARQTGKFVKEYISDLLKACHRGKIAGRG